MIIEDVSQVEYRTAASIRDRCFARDGSYLFPEEEIWTQDNIKPLVDGMHTSWLETGKGSFLEALKHQLSGLPIECTKLIADGIALYYLFPLDNNVKKATKERQIATVLSWKGLAPPEILSMTFGGGIGNVGTFYVTHEDQLIRGFLLFAARGKERGIDFYSASECQSLLESLRTTENIVAGTANVLLHLLFPQDFEPIASNQHKRAIVAHYAGNKEASADLEALLRDVRAANEARFGNGFSFYAPSTRAEWDTDLKPSIVLQPCGNAEVYKNYQNSVQQLVPISEILSRLGSGIENIARRLGSYDQVAVWGVEGERNSNIWKRLKPGDITLFSRNNEIFSSGVVLDKVESADLAEFLWGSRGWKFVYFLSDIRQQHLSYVEFNKLLGYDEGYIIRDFRILDAKQSEAVRHALKLRDEVVAVPETTPLSADPVGDLARILYWDRDRAERLWKLANSKGGHQLIFLGPPGTGKTYVAFALAQLLAEDGFVQKVQFHPSYSYEDFIEGIRPRLGDVADIRPSTDGKARGTSSHLEYQLVDGVFKEFVERAQRDPAKRYVFVIDELNRANLANVFGELLYCLEYRGPDHAVALPYSHTTFWLPENLWILGTMNTADRSIALVDAAFRRRFKHNHLGPDYSVLRSWLNKNGHTDKADAFVSSLEALNTSLEPRLGADRLIGHSFLMTDDIADGSLERVWDQGLEPVLHEYFFGLDSELEDAKKAFLR